MADETNLDSLAKTLMEKIQKMGSRGAGDGDLDDFEYEGRGKVPIHRLRQVVQERNEARTQLGELAQQVEQLKAGYADQLQQLQQQAAEQVANIGKTHQQDLALVEAGIRDPLGRKAVREAWDAQPKDGRGKSPVEWWQGLQQARSAHAEDPEKNAAPTIPATLVGYLPSDAPAPAPSPAPGGRGAPPSPPQGRSVKGLSEVPIDQGMDAFFAGLSSIDPSAA